MSSIPQAKGAGTLGGTSSGRNLRSPVGKKSEFADMVKEMRELLILESNLVASTFPPDDQTQRQRRLPPRVTSARVPLHTVSDFATNIERRTKCNPQEGLLGVSIFDESGLQVTSSGELDDGTGSAVGVLTRIFQLCNSIENPAPLVANPPRLAVLTQADPTRGNGEGEEEWASRVILQAEQALLVPLPLGPCPYPQELCSVVIEVITSSNNERQASLTGHPESSLPSAPTPAGATTINQSGSGGRVICLAPCTDDLPPSHHEIAAAMQQLSSQNGSENPLDNGKTDVNTHAAYLALHIQHAAKRAATELTLENCRLQQQGLLSSLAFVCSVSEKAGVALNILEHRRGLLTRMRRGLVVPKGADDQRGSLPSSPSNGVAGGRDDDCTLMIATVHKVAAF